jgi:hypothetical protein
LQLVKDRVLVVEVQCHRGGVPRECLRDRPYRPLTARLRLRHKINRDVSGSRCQGVSSRKPRRPALPHLLFDPHLAAQVSQVNPDRCIQCRVHPPQQGGHRKGKHHHGERCERQSKDHALAKHVLGPGQLCGDLRVEPTAPRSISALRHHGHPLHDPSGNHRSLLTTLGRRRTATGPAQYPGSQRRFGGVSHLLAPLRNHRNKHDKPCPRQRSKNQRAGHFPSPTRPPSPSCPVANSPTTVVIRPIRLPEARREDRAAADATHGPPGRDTRDTRTRHAGGGS